MTSGFDEDEDVDGLEVDFGRAKQFVDLKLVQLVSKFAHERGFAIG